MELVNLERVNNIKYENILNDNFFDWKMPKTGKKLHEKHGSYDLAFKVEVQAHVNNSSNVFKFSARSGLAFESYRVQMDSGRCISVFARFLSRRGFRLDRRSVKVGIGKWLPMRTGVHNMHCISIKEPKNRNFFTFPRISSCFWLFLKFIYLEVKPAKWWMELILYNQKRSPVQLLTHNQFHY